MPPGRGPFIGVFTVVGPTLASDGLYHEGKRRTLGACGLGGRGWTLGEAPDVNYPQSNSSIRANPHLCHPPGLRIVPAPVTQARKSGTPPKCTAKSKIST